MFKTVHFHGPSGSGKDTQVDLLEDKIEFERIGTGDMFRTMKKEGHPEEEHILKVMDEGGLPNTADTYRLLAKYVKKFDENIPWFFMSTVRRVNQIQALDALLEENNRQLDLFIHFKLSDEAAVERLSKRSYCPKCDTTYHEIYKKEKVKGICNEDGEKLVKRDDDKPESVLKRLEWYNENIKGILDEYDNRGILIEIDGTPSIEEVHKDVLKALKIG